MKLLFTFLCLALCLAPTFSKEECGDSCQKDPQAIPLQGSLLTPQPLQSITIVEPEQITRLTHGEESSFSPEYSSSSNSNSNSFASSSLSGSVVYDSESGSQSSLSSFSSGSGSESEQQQQKEAEQVSSLDCSNHVSQNTCCEHVSHSCCHACESESTSQFSSGSEESGAVANRAEQTVGKIIDDAANEASRQNPEAALEKLRESIKLLKEEEDRVVAERNEISQQRKEILGESSF